MEHEERRRKAPSNAQVQPQHVFGSRPPDRARFRHFPGSPKPLGQRGYSTMLPSRNSCISLKTHDGDEFYSTINRGFLARPFSHRRPLAAAQKGVKPCQMFSAVTCSKQRIETQNKCQEIAIAFRTPSRRLSARIRATNSGYDGAGMFPAISRNLRSEN